MKGNAQKTFFDELTRFSKVLNRLEKNCKSYILPTSGLHPGKGTQVICKSAVHWILDIGQTKWNSALKNNDPDFRNFREIT